MASRTKKDKVVIFGADGLLGKEFATLSGALSGMEVRAYNRAAADITDKQAVAAILSRERPRVVVNAAVRVNVDYCERFPLSAWSVNTLGAGTIMESIRASGLAETVFVQMSTSDVFDGRKKKYTPADAPSPLNVYGWSKLGGEKITEEIGAGFSGRFYIVRTGWLYGASRDTFVDMVVGKLHAGERVDAISDQYNIPVWTRDAVKAVWVLVGEAASRPSGVYHLGVSAGEKGASKYDMAREAARALGLDASFVKKCSFADMLSVPRPRNVVLAHSPALPVFSWKKSLAEYLMLRYGREQKIRSHS